MRIIIKDIITVTMNQKDEIGTYTIVIDGGRIQSLLGPRTKAALKERKDDIVISGKNRVAIPGLFNGHVHSDVTLARGLGDGLTLYEQDNDSFVSKKKWFREELDREARYYSRLLLYTEAMKCGTTYICDVPFWFYEDDLVSPLKETGLKGAVVLDYRKNFLDGEVIDKKTFFRIAQHLTDNGITPIIAGPSEENYDRELLIRLKTWAEELDTYIQMHLAETQWRVDIVKTRHAKSSVRFLREIGFLNRRVIGAHGVYIDLEELSMLGDAGARIVNCPTAEMKLSDGIAPVVKMMEHSIPLNIGTDGSLWNDSADMFSEMKVLMLLQRIAQGASSFPARNSLRAGTEGGARVFGLEKELGSIEEGKRACLVLVAYDKPHLVPLYNGHKSNVVQVLISCGKASDVDTVISDGNIVVENGNLKTIDEEELVRKAQELGCRRFSNLQ